MKPKIFIDGQEGTTGLVIADRLAARDDIEVLAIDPEKRKDAAARKALINAADLVFLCLPDAAAKEAVTLVENPSVRLIDASTAHRTDPGFTYGFPELGFDVANARFTANPGCHASGFIASVFPLVKTGIVPAGADLCCFSLTGYTGGGKKMIASYESAERADALAAPGIYGITQAHKHLPEMQKVCGLLKAPLFSPIVADFPRGMATSVMLPADALCIDDGKYGSGSLPEKLRAFYGAFYKGSKVISVCEESAGGTIYANTMAGKDGMRILVEGNDERITVTALFDNLGKGACGAALQNMNLMLGFPETEGLIL